MTDLIAQLFSVNYLAFYLINFSSLLYSLFNLKSSPNKLKFLYVPAGKSATGARLLGGLSLTIPLIFSFLNLYIFNAHSTETRLIQSSFIPIILISISGFIDDKYEVRARIKLFMQIISVVGFCFLNKDSINSDYPYLAFIMSSVIGLGLVNGCNLLDGLDTMAIKVSLVTSFAFLVISIISNSLPSALISGITISSLLAFYYFNREPAKIYLGEIGGSLLGITFFLQSIICYTKLHVTSGHLQTYFIILTASLIPLSELGISFARRLWAKKSPFRGDRLHLHYILKSKYHLSASKTSSIIAIYSGLIVTIGLSLSLFILPIYAFFISLSILATLYTLTCSKVWKNTKDISQRRELFNIIKSDSIFLVNVRDLAEIESIIREESKEIYEESKIAA